jgi:hypothetical protein
MNKIEFYIDTNSPEAYQYVSQIIAENPSVNLINSYEEYEGCFFLSLKGTWDDYRKFLRSLKEDKNDRKYNYSLYHYEE